MEFKQIEQLKTKYSDALMLIRIGDFYEAYAADAITIGKELDLTLTGRTMKGATDRVPMVGIPYHTLDKNIAKLVANGYKVAIAETTEQEQVTKKESIIKEKKIMEQNVTRYTDDERKEIVGNSKHLFSQLLTDGNLKALLCYVGRNGKFTLNNTLFMLDQNPDMTVAKNMTEWNNIGRNIIPNSQSLEIMSPIKEEREKELKDGEEPEYDDNGQQIVQKYNVTTGFKPTYVFDISQTSGKEYAPFKLTDKMTDEEKRLVLKGVRYELGKRGYKIDFVDADKLGKKNGNVNRKTKKVEIKKGMDNLPTTLTLLHESASALNGGYKYQDFEGLKGEEAYALESSCMDCIFAAHFGRSTDKFDFSFTSAWNENEKEAFYNNVNLLCQSNTKLIEGIENSFAMNNSAKNENSAIYGNTPPPSLFRGRTAGKEVEAS